MRTFLDEKVFIAFSTAKVQGLSVKEMVGAK